MRRNSGRRGEIGERKVKQEEEGRIVYTLTVDRYHHTPTDEGDTTVIDGRKAARKRKRKRKEDIETSTVIQGRWLSGTKSRMGFRGRGGGRPPVDRRDARVIYALRFEDLLRNVLRVLQTQNGVFL